MPDVTIYNENCCSLNAVNSLRHLSKNEAADIIELIQKFASNDRIVQTDELG